MYIYNIIIYKNSHILKSENILKELGCNDETIEFTLLIIQNSFEITIK